MQKLISFFKLIRWPNLVFIILTQVAFYFFVIQTQSNLIHLPWLHFGLLVVASVFIAAGGYIINDYFDVNIDLINKPSKMIIGKVFKRRTAIIMHFLLSAIGVVLSFYVSIALQQKWWWVGFANTFVTVLLVFYSINFKRKLLSGNIIVSFLTAWVILLLVLSQFQLYIPNERNVVSTNEAYSKLFRIGILYAAFAFIITIMREVVKDMEDYIGDLNDGCKTMPIVWGFTVSKAFVAICTVILIALLLVLQIYVLQFYWYVAVAYCFVLIVLPLLFTLKVLLAAQTSLHYAALSNLYKGIMLLGILSMIFLKYMSNKIILASQSPRRKQLLEQAEIEFEVVVLPTNESFPQEFTVEQAVLHIAKQKALVVQQLHIDAIIIAADTIVVLNNEIIGKPKNEADAIAILLKLSGMQHSVITGVVMLNGNVEKIFYSKTLVQFHELTLAQIQHYITTYKPYDKAGAYAIQEWIGAIGIASIHGDYYNVMGLPINKVVKVLEEWI